MKISINGDIIDTKDIYNITKLESFECNNGYICPIPFNAAITDSSCLGFKIKIFNHKKIHVWYNISRECGIDYESSRERHDHKSSIARDDLWKKNRRI